MSNVYQEKLARVIKGRVVIFIDAANFEQSIKDMPVRARDKDRNIAEVLLEDLIWKIDYQKFKDFFISLGNIQSIRFYTAEFQSYGHYSFRYFLNKGLHFKLITKPLKKSKSKVDHSFYVKANFDVEIAVDSVFLINSFDTLILFSGDSDFKYLINFLKGRGKIVIGFSRSGHIARELPGILSSYFDIKNFRSIFMKVVSKTKNPGQSPGFRS